MTKVPCGYIPVLLVLALSCNIRSNVFVVSKDLKNTGPKPLNGKSWFTSFVPVRSRGVCLKTVALFMVASCVAQ